MTSDRKADAATEMFVTHRNLLFTVAYEMLGSATDAEDVLQETWLRWVRVDLDTVRGACAEHDIAAAAGLPVQVIAETREWRKICDPEGSVAWIHRTVASGRRTVFNTAAEETPLRARPEADAPVRAVLRPRSLAALDDCADGWCRVRAGRVRGWAEQSSLFGVQTAPLCPATAPAGAGERRG